MSVVHRMTRRLIALTAAYAIALQATLAGFALLAASAQAAPQLCAAAGHDSRSGSMPMGADCAACPALCGNAGSDAVAPGGFTLAPPVVVSFALDRRIAPVAPSPAQRLLPPSRAPPDT
jgi:hypothetical protein